MQIVWIGCVEKAELRAKVCEGVVAGIITPSAIALAFTQSFSSQAPSTAQSGDSGSHDIKRRSHSVSGVRVRSAVNTSSSAAAAATPHGYAKYDRDWESTVKASPKASTAHGTPTQRVRAEDAHGNDSSPQSTTSTPARQARQGSVTHGRRVFYTMKPSSSSGRRFHDYSEDDEVGDGDDDVHAMPERRRARPSTAGRVRHHDGEFEDPVFKNWASATTPEGHVYYYHRYLRHSVSGLSKFWQRVLFQDSCVRFRLCSKNRRLIRLRDA